MENNIVLGKISFNLEELTEIRSEINPNILGNMLDGVKVRNLIVGKLEKLVFIMQQSIGIVPGLGIIQTGDDLASNTYVNLKKKFASKAGFYIEHIKIDEKWSQNHGSLLTAIHEFNENPKIHGFIVQLPLEPADNFDLDDVLSSIDPTKDADCLHPYNVGKFWSGDSYDLAPATPQGSLMILQAYGINPKKENGKYSSFSVGIAGRSDIAGKPFARVFEAKSNGFNSAPHIMNSSIDVKNNFLRNNYDILISAIGIPEFFSMEDVPLGSYLIIDVGTNFINGNQGSENGIKGKLIQVGDFSREAYQNARFVIPSPGGSGPGTIAALIANTYNLACKKMNYFPSEINLKL
jgi:methylenetetrahydrofolate dehydrogenase (NADP+) / methenyltetrahydrofolate cyclohydrolase